MITMVSSRAQVQVHDRVLVRDATIENTAGVIVVADCDTVRLPRLTDILLV